VRPLCLEGCCPALPHWTDGVMTSPDLAQLDHLPVPSGRRVAVHVTREAERALRRGHPWLFDRAIRQQNHEGSPGDLAVVFDRRRRFLAVGLYDPRSTIRVRVLHRGKPVKIDRGWFETTLAAAAELRAPLRQQPAPRATTGFRLVHGENDSLPGLVVDRYAQTLVIKLYTLAWIPHLRDVVAALVAACPFERLVLRLGRAAQAGVADMHGLRDGRVLAGPALESPVLFQENGLTFEADPACGQKTGFFLDQRDNRSRVESLAAGRAMLNVFSYTGGFSVYAARGGAPEIVSVDASAPALQAAVRNLAHNRHLPAVAVADHHTLTGDAFQVLDQMARDGRRFGLVVIDPPAFAHQKTQVGQALAAYGRLTRLGLGVLEPGGVLVQASCSSRVDEETFCGVIHRAARDVGRPLQEIERTGHALDHPITFAEGAYLKCLFAIVP